MIKYKQWSFNPPREDLNVCIAIPCHVRDIPVFKNYCLPSVQRLNPHPSHLVVAFNNGLDLSHDNALQKIRVELFDKCFNEYGADVVFSWGADGYFRKHLVRYADRDRLVSVKWVPLRLIGFITRNLATLVARKYWSGAYFLPEQVWRGKCRVVFDGNDTSIQEAVGDDYLTYPVPQVIHMRVKKQRYIDSVFKGYKGEQYNVLRKAVKLAQVVDY